jgi:hypothetical protein
MTPHYNNTVLIAHNASNFDNYPVINALIDHHGVVPDKILYNGSKIMYMHVAKGLDLTFRDSLNFLGMRLSENDHNFEYDKITIVEDNLPLHRWGKYPLQSSFKSKHPGNMDNRIPNKLRESRKVKSSPLATCMYMIGLNLQLRMRIQTEDIQR